MQKCVPFLGYEGGSIWEWGRAHNWKDKEYNMSFKYIMFVFELVKSKVPHPLFNSKIYQSASPPKKKNLAMHVDCHSLCNRKTEKYM